MHSTTPRCRTPWLLAFACGTLFFCWSSKAAACTTSCHHSECDGPNLRYGKFCGITLTGCDGEPPCDAVDGCCQAHDTCVADRGMLFAQACHAEFQVCLSRVELDPAPGFTSDEKCPKSQVIAMLRRSVELSEVFTSMFGDAILKAQNDAAAVEAAL